MSTGRPLGIGGNGRPSLPLARRRLHRPQPQRLAILQAHVPLALRQCGKFADGGAARGNGAMQGPDPCPGARANEPWANGHVRHGTPGCFATLALVALHGFFTLGRALHLTNPLRKTLVLLVATACVRR